MLAATDPANVYGSILRWPQVPEEDDTADPTPRMLTRSVGASVILRNGELVAFTRRNNPNMQVFLPADEPERSQVARDLSQFLAHTAQGEMQRRESDHRAGMLITTVNGTPVSQHFMARSLQDAGFQAAPLGFNLRRVLIPIAPAAETPASEGQ